MQAPAVTYSEAKQSRRALAPFLTEHLSAILEDRSVRAVVTGLLLVIASAFSLVPNRMVVDSDWMFIIPVAVAAIAAGLREGLVTGMVASMLATACVAFRSGGIDGTVMVSLLTANFALNGIIAAVLGAFAEAHQQVQEKLRRLATLDPLTQVSNVASFYQQLGFLEAQPSDFAVMLVDLDNLKALNDTHGHQAGSAAIQRVAGALRRVVRGSDCVARYGGDEFVVILRDANRAGAQIVVNRLREMLVEEPLAGTDVLLSVSAGVALYGEDGANAEELLAFADEAMYADKKERKVLSRSEPSSGTIDLTW